LKNKEEFKQHINYNTNTYYAACIKASRPKGPGFAFAPWKGARMPCPLRGQGRVIPLG